MAKTVLKVVQDILSKMDSDEVNTISSSTEGLQVAEVVSSIYQQIVSEYDLPSTFRESQLQAENNGRYVVMLLPEELSNIKWIKYDKRVDINGNPCYNNIRYITTEEYIDIHTNIQVDTNTKTIELESGTKIQVYKDRSPSYWTSFDNSTLFFDAYNEDVESQLTDSKSSVYAEQQLELSAADDNVIDLPDELLQLLEANATEYCFDLWKGSVPKKVRDLARKARVRMQRNKDKFRMQHYTGADYGRKGKGRVGYKQGEFSVDSGNYVPLPPYFK